MRLAIVEAMIDLSQKPIPTRMPSETTSPITSGDVKIFSRPGATDAPQASSRAKPSRAGGRSAWVWLRASSSARSPLRPAGEGPALERCLDRRDPGSRPCVAAELNRASRRARASAARRDRRRLLRRLRSWPGHHRRRRNSRPVLPAGRLSLARALPSSSSARIRNIRQSPTVISSPWRMLPVVILWPLITTYSASGDASTLNLLDSPANAPVDRPDELALKHHVAGRAGAEQDRMIARELDELNAALTVVYFECGHADDDSPSRSQSGLAERFLGDDLKIVAVAARDDGESRDADLGRLPPLVPDLELGQPPLGRLGIKLEHDAFADCRRPPS